MDEIDSLALDLAKEKSPMLGGDNAAIVARTPSLWEKLRSFLDPNNVFDPVNFPNQNPLMDAVPVISQIRSVQRLNSGEALEALGKAIKANSFDDTASAGFSLGLDAINLALPIAGLYKNAAERAAAEGLSKEAGIFGGIKAKNAPLEDLAKAKTAIEAGADAKQVWKDTGWYQAPWDKQWRFEIPDNEAVLTPDWNTAGNLSLRTDSDPLQTVLLHNELRKNYPLEKLPTVASFKDLIGGHKGYFEPASGKIALKSGVPIEDGQSTLLHEIQHSIQHKEGFGSGADINRIYDVIGKEKNALEMQITDINTKLSSASKKGDKVLYNQLLDDRQKIVDQYQAMGGNDPVWLSEEPYKRYKRIPGEAEARLVQKRMDYTPQQRRDIFPLDDLDVPLDELLPAESGSGVAFNVEDLGKKNGYKFRISDEYSFATKEFTADTRDEFISKLKKAMLEYQVEKGEWSSGSLQTHTGQNWISSGYPNRTRLNVRFRSELPENIWETVMNSVEKGKYFDEQMKVLKSFSTAGKDNFTISSNPNIIISLDNPSMQFADKNPKPNLKLVKKEGENSLASLAGLLALGGASDTILNGE